MTGVNEQIIDSQEKISPWRLPPSGLTLVPDQVHLWRVWLEVSAADRTRLGQFLSGSELERAARFHFARDRERYIAGRGALRVILAGYLHIRPEQVEFGYGPYKKPALASGPDNFEFNISHSYTLMLVAVSMRRMVGVDLERVRPLDDFERLAQSIFSARENEALAAVPKPHRLQSFFACWTRKEAFIKAVGQGLYYPLDQFDVSLKPDEPAALLRVKNNPQASTGWSMQTLTPAPGYVGALVVECGPCELKFWQYQKTQVSNAQSGKHKQTF